MDEDGDQRVYRFLVGWRVSVLQLLAEHLLGRDEQHLGDEMGLDRPKLARLNALVISPAINWTAADSLWSSPASSLLPRCCSWRRSEGRPVLANVALPIPDHRLNLVRSRPIGRRDLLG